MMLRHVRMLIKLLTKLAVMILVIFVALPLLLNARSEGVSETAYNMTAAAYLKVRVKLLNGRSAPRKTASKEAFFDFGDTLYATGEWSDDHKWVEVDGGETGTVWVSIRYVSERTDSFKAKNANYDKVKVRQWPEVGKVGHYIYRGQTVTITQVVLGWGKTKWGWVDLYYLEGV